MQNCRALSFWYLTEKLSDIKNRPDPHRQRAVRWIIVQAVESVQKAVERYSKAGGQTEAEVWRQLATSGALRSVDPCPAAYDLVAAATVQPERCSRRKTCPNFALKFTHSEVRSLWLRVREVR